jgi:hypothetical protein
MTCKIGILSVTLLIVLSTGALFCQEAALAAGLKACMVEGDRVVVSLEAGAYRITDGVMGQHIEMEGFGDIMMPGGPMLPMKRFLIALPPGTRALR